MVDTKIKYGLVGVLSILLASTGTLLLVPSDLDRTYVCTANEKVAFFDRLSSTSKTGYYTVDGVEKSLVCTNGVWQKIEAYAKERNISIDTLLEKANNDVTPSVESNCWRNGVIQYSCNPERCEEVCT